jgi:two-component system chemotaxis response regulator CheB
MDRQAGAVSVHGGASTAAEDGVARCDLDVVAIGASAGGVAALPLVLSALPRTFPAAIVIVQHLDPHSRSFLASVLSRACRLPVREAESGDVVRAGVVYVAPPASHLELRGGELVLTNAAPVHFVRPSVDVLFRSVAAACGSHAVGVILTGAGVDGAAGLRAIKNSGGRTIVQDPKSAEYTGMPTAACATGCADFTLALTEIGPALADLTPTTPAARVEPADG